MNEPQTDNGIKEIPVRPDKAEALAEKRGTFAAHVEDDPMSGDEVERYRPHLVRVLAAAEDLTTRQIQILRCFVAGMSQSETARHLGIKQPSVHQALYGQRTSSGAIHGGILAKVAARVGMGDLPPPAAQQVGLPPAEPTAEVDDIDGWFRGHLSRPERFVPLVVLFWANQIADAKRTLRIDDLNRRLPVAAVSQSLTFLKTQGWVSTDGVTMTILKTPTSGAST